MATSGTMTESEQQVYSRLFNADSRRKALTRDFGMFVGVVNESIFRARDRRSLDGPDTDLERAGEVRLSYTTEAGVYFSFFRKDGKDEVARRALMVNGLPPEVFEDRGVVFNRLCPLEVTTIVARLAVDTGDVQVDLVMPHPSESAGPVANVFSSGNLLDLTMNFGIIATDKRTGQQFIPLQ